MEDPEVQALFNEFTKAPRKLKDPVTIDTHSRMYWKNIFKLMDTYTAIPYHKRENILKDALKDDDLIERLRNIYDVYTHPNIVEHSDEDDDAPDFEPVRVLSRVFQNVEYNSAGFTSDLKMKQLKRSHSSLAKMPGSDINVQRYETKDYRKELTKTKEEGCDESQNMYMNFLNKPESKANRWRPKPPVTMKGMSLNAKCDAITKEIASDFVEWMQNLGGESKCTLDVPGVEALFEIGFNCHAADSLMIQVQELNSVTESVAHSRQTPQAAYSTQLYRQLFRDMNAVKSKDANFAFGTMLPPAMRSGTTQDSSVSKWLENKRVPERLATMAVVWEGIEALKSTEGYCNWLREHEEIAPPSYLWNKILQDDSKKADQLSDGKSGLSVQEPNDSAQSFRGISMRQSSLTFA